MKQTRIFITLSLLVLLSTAASSFAYYDTQAGRFLQRDPLGYVDGMNLYDHVSQNKSDRESRTIAVTSRQMCCRPADAASWHAQGKSEKMSARAGKAVP